MEEKVVLEKKLEEETAMPEETEVDETNAQKLTENEEIEVNKSEVKGKKSMDAKATKKDILIVLGIALASIAIVISIIVATVFGIAGTKAKEQIHVDKTEGADIGKARLLLWLNSMQIDSNNQLGLPENTLIYTEDEVTLDDVDKNLVVERPIENSHYVYTFEFEARDEDYVVKVDSRSGEVLSIEIVD